MGETRTITLGARRRAVTLLSFAALCVVLVAAIGIPSAGASRAKVIGQTKHTPKASCPNVKAPTKCNVIGRVTGFMTRADGKKQPFRVKQDGKLVAWAVDLGKPTNKHKLGELKFFGALFQNKQYGNQPTGRIAVLKHRKKLRYKLRRQSPTVELGSAMGRKEIFTLNKPLTVRKGDLVAFSSPTWTPNFTNVGVSASGNKWRASRKKDNCEPKGTTDKAKRRFARNSHAHQKVGSTHNYECLYSGGRIVYWAYLAPNKK
jgi:hypothetical protein